MQTQRTYWPCWAEFLHHWGLQDLAVWMLEAGGPLTLLGAQGLYFGKPFLGQMRVGRHVEALAQLLEDSGEAQAFAVFLRKETSL